MYTGITFTEKIIYDFTIVQSAASMIEFRLEIMSMQADNRKVQQLTLR